MRVPVLIAATLFAVPILTSCHLFRDAPAQEQSEESAVRPPSPSVPKDLILNARMDAAGLTGTAPENVTVVSAEAVSWPNEALGCPPPGMPYPQEVTPGYQIKLRAGSATLDYRAGRTGSVVLCPAERAKPPLAISPPQPGKSVGGQPSGAAPASRSPSAPATAVPASPSASALDKLMVRAKTDAARLTGTRREDITVISAGEVSWPDPSLGCPRRGVMYPQVVTPGYQIKLRAGGQILDYRAASSGSLQLCPAELAQPAPAG
jgi:hypothetical protein